jgi:hypothetical protein
LSMGACVRVCCVREWCLTLCRQVLARQVLDRIKEGPRVDGRERVRRRDTQLPCSYHAATMQLPRSYHAATMMQLPCS